MKYFLHRRWFIYMLSCLLFTFSQFYRSSVAVISPNLIEELNLGPKNLSLISAAFFYAFGTMQIPISLFLDRIGPRILMSGLSMVAASGAVIFAFGDSAASLTIGRLLLGIGMACNLMGPLKLITSWFSPARFATLSAIFLSLGTAGNIAAATPLVWLTNAIGWRHGFLAIALCNIILVILFFVVCRDQPEAKQAILERKSPRTVFAEALRDLHRLLIEKDYWLISAGTFFRYGVYASVQALWAAPFLMTTLGLSQTTTGNLLFAASIGLILGSPFCGWMSDSLIGSRKQVVIGGLIAMAAVLATLSVFPFSMSLPPIFALFFLFGFASSSGQVMYAHVKERMPAENAGTAMTGINFFTMIGVAFFLHGLGWIMQEFFSAGSLTPTALRLSFFAFSACLAFGAFLYTFTLDTGAKNSRS